MKGAVIIQKTYVKPSRIGSTPKAQFSPRRSPRHVNKSDDNQNVLQVIPDERKAARAEVPKWNPSSIQRSFLPVSTSPIIEDPMFTHMANAVSNPWTIGEKFLFLQLYRKHGKKFSKIANELRYKDIHDVTRLYYTQKLNLRLKLFRKRPGRRRSFSDDFILQIASSGVVSSRMGGE